VTEPWINENMGDPLQSQRILRLDLLPAAQQSRAVGLLWLDPAIGQDAAREMCARLLVTSPQREQVLRDRSADFIARVDSLMREYQRKLIRAQYRRLLVLSSDFDPLLARMGLEPVMAVQAQPTRVDDSAMALLKLSAREKGTRLLIVPADTPAVVVHDLQVRGGLQIVLIDTLGSSAPSGRTTYVDLVRFNLEQLLRATTVQ
jgi:zinc transport system substrate-binding protein